MIQLHPEQSLRNRRLDNGQDQNEKIETEPVRGRYGRERERRGNREPDRSHGSNEDGNGEKQGNRNHLRTQFRVSTPDERARDSIEPTRWKYRTRPAGWLPPSLWHRVQSTMRWVKWGLRFATAGGAEVSFGVEISAFDVAKLRDPTLEGSDYQEGPLYRANLREAVCARDGRWCGRDSSRATPSRRSSDSRTARWGMTRRQRRANAA